MPYQGSAQSIGFRNRTVIDPSDRMRQEAQQLKERGREQVRGMETQASQQIREMQRIGDIQASNAEFELKSLAKFSATLDSFVKETVVPFVQQKKEENEFNQELSYYLQDADRLKAAEEEVDNSVVEGQKIHIALNSEANKADNPEIEDRIRASSTQHTRGWQLANLREKANGWGTYLISELDTSTVRLKDDRTGEAFSIKDAKDAYQKELAIRYLQADYIKQNRGNLSAKVIVTKLIQPMSVATSTQRKIYQQNFRRDAATQALDAEENNLTTALTDPLASLESKQLALKSFLTVSPSQYKIVNPNEEHFSASRRELLNLVKTLIKADPYQADSIIEVLRTTQMPNHPAGAGTLFDHYKDEFNPQALKALSIEANNADFNRTTAAKNNEAQIEFEETIRTWSEDNPSPDVTAAMAQKFSQKYPLATELTNKLRAWEPMFLGVTASEEKVAALMAAYGGELPASEIQNLDSSVREKYKNKIVENPFGSQDKAARRKAENLITAAIQKARRISLNDSVLYDDAQRAQTAAHNMITQKARSLFQLAKENGTPITEGQAVLQAGSLIADQINADQEKPGSDFYAVTGEGFTKFALTDDTNGLNKLFEQRKLLFRKAKTLLNQSPDALINNAIITNPADLELTASGTPKSLFYQLAKLDPKRNAWEILNAQRQKANLAPASIPTEAQTLQKYFDKNPQAKQLFYNQPSYQRINRSLQSLGVVSAPNLLKAIGFQESGSGNYKADNPAAYGPSNPALGKYQILWTTALSWAQRAGMPPPASKEAFKNDPQYQEALARWAINEYVRQASKRTDDPKIAIRMAAAMWYGGAGAIDSYDRTTKETGGKYPSMREYTTSVLNYYLTGT